MAHKKTDEPVTVNPANLATPGPHLCSVTWQDPSCVVAGAVQTCVQIQTHE